MASTGTLREAARRIAGARAPGALRLNNLGLDEIPADAERIYDLSVIDISNNSLTEVPALVLRHPRLHNLNISGNKIRVLPHDLVNLTALKRLDCSHNELEELPPELDTLPALEFLDLRDNVTLGIPPEILAQYSNPESILTYYYRNVIEDSRRLNEAKLLIVGQGGVGKTSLVKRILSDSFDPDEVKTQGIQVEQWIIPAKDEAGFENEQVRLNVWDFGGQEIMHATHQFFLTKRSIYLIVISARQGEDEGRLHYWLKIVESFGADSPVIVVVNQEDEHHLELNENRLRKDFPTIVGFAYTSCKTGAGIDALAQLIQSNVHILPHVYDRLPLSYFTVKSELEEMSRSRDFISIAEYETLCAESNLRKVHEQSRLLRFLHDLGSVLNFDDPDDPFQLRDTNILNPSWVTTGVYRIINSNALMQAGGILRYSTLAEVLSDSSSYPKGRYGFIVGMMRKFELCFEFPDSNGQLFLVPELLSKNEPDLDWHQENAIRFEIHYESVVPPGILSRFIVRMHGHLTPNPTYWRSGVLLQIEDCRCQVRGDPENKRIVILVVGASGARRRALSVVRSAFREIHRTVPAVEVTEMVPLPGEGSATVPYEFLLELERAKIEIPYRFPGGEGAYYVGELLDGVDEGRLRGKPATSPDGQATTVPAGAVSPVTTGALVLAVTVAAATVILTLAVATRISGNAAVPMLSAAVAVILVLLVMSGVLLRTISPREAVSLLRSGIVSRAGDSRPDVTAGSEADNAI